MLRYPDIRSRPGAWRVAWAGLWLTAGPLFAQGLPVGQPETLGFSPERLQRIDTLIAEAVEEAEIAGAVALIARRGRVAFLESYGMADIDDGEPMRTDTIFRIASMTKPITSLAVMMLYEEGHFFLSDPVSDFIPEFSAPRVLDSGSDGAASVAAEGEITIHQLLTHTSGISYTFISNPGARARLAALYRDAGVSDGLSETDGRIADLSARLGGLPLLFEPGSAYAYGLSIDVLGHLVEVVSGMTLAAFFETRIFRPLGMNDTGFFLDDDAVQRLAALYTDADGGIREITDETMRDGYLVYSATYHHGGPRTYYSGGAGLVSTVSDYARFLQMLLNGGELDGVRLVSPPTVAMMTRNSIGELSVGPGVKFGLGFGVVEDPGLTADPRSDGTYYWGGIFNTRFFVDPAEELIGVFMSQRIPGDAGRIRDRFVHAVYQAAVE